MVDFMGYRNTQYYHTKTVVRRRHNRITMLRDINRNQVDNEKEVSKMVVSFYQNLFKKENIQKKELETQSKYPQVKEFQNVKLV